MIEMTNNELLLGQNPVRNEEKEVSGQLLNINGEEFYQIRNYDSMAPFFMSLVSDSNHWMFHFKHRRPVGRKD